ncbi:MAG: SsgA family sporulation/cell division regulator [Candidatus Nanopelagicales bacterium]|nr:SsgA family sporulation/cell division regulator [Candidatus Nanopelagicales bacterium]
MNQSAHAPAVSRDLQMQVVLDNDARVALPASVSYCANDPFAVTASFRTGEGNVTWVFARDLLRDGLTEAVGEGDVAIRPVHPSRGAKVLITLSSPSGSARLEGPRDDLRLFVNDMYSLVPEDEEWRYVRIDSVINELLGSSDDAR